MHDSSLKVVLTFEGLSYRLRDGTCMDETRDPIDETRDPASDGRAALPPHHPVLTRGRLPDLAGTYILADASGVVGSDEITVLMGPSGCGPSPEDPTPCPNHVRRAC